MTRTARIGGRPRRSRRRAPRRARPDRALSFAGRLSVSRTPHGGLGLEQDRSRSGLGHRSGPSSTTSASTAIAPAGRCDDRVEVDLEDVRALHPEATEGDEHRPRRPPDRPAGRPRTPPRRRAPRSSSSIAPAAARVERGEPDRDVVEDLGQDAAQPDQHGRPELRVAAQAEDQLDARRRHRLDEQAADASGRGAGRSRAASGRRRRPRRRRAARAPRPPTSLLWASPTASSLSATGRPIRRAAATAAGASVTTVDLGRPGSRRRPTRARLSRSDSATGGRAGRPRSGAGRRRTRSGPRRAPASSARHGPSSPATLVASLPAGDLGDRPEGRDGAAQERCPVAVPVEQRLGLGRRLAGGQRHVDGQDRGAVRPSPPGARRSPRWPWRPRTAASGTGSRGRGRGRRRRPTRPSPRTRAP